MVLVIVVNVKRVFTKRLLELREGSGENGGMDKYFLGSCKGE